MVICQAFPDECWVIVHSKRAEAYALGLLSGDVPKTPDWAIDLVVVRSEGVVAFSRHDSSSIIAYSPTEKPVIENMMCELTWANWHICDVLH